MKTLHEKLLLILIFLLPFQTAYLYREIFVNGYKLQYATGALYLTEILLLFTLLFFVGNTLRQVTKEKVRPKFEFTKDRMFFGVMLVFLLYVFASILWADEKHIAFEHAVVILEGIILGLLILISNTKTSTLIKTFLAGSAIAALVGIMQVMFQQTISVSWLGLTHYDIATSGTSIVGNGMRWLRAYGTFPHPNMFGGWMAVSLVLSLCLVLKKQIREMYGYGLLVLFSTGLVLSFSRSAWLATLFAVLVLLTSKLFQAFKNQGNTTNSNPKRSLHAPPALRRSWLVEMTYLKLFALFGALGIFFVAILYPLFASRVAMNTNYEIRSVNERQVGYEIAGEIISNNLWIGTGAGNYTIAVYAALNEYPRWDFQPVHNVYMLMIAELGIVGMMLILVADIFWIRWLRSRGHADGWGWGIELMSIFVIIAFFDHYLYALYPGMMLAGIIFGLSSRLILLPPE